MMELPAASGGCVPTSATDREPALAGWRELGGRDLVDDRGGGPARAPLEQRGNAGIVAFGLELDATVGEVPHPAAEPQAASLGGRRGPIRHALDASRNDHVHATHVASMGHFRDRSARVVVPATVHAVRTAAACDLARAMRGRRFLASRVAIARADKLLKPLPPRSGVGLAPTRGMSMALARIGPTTPVVRPRVVALTATPARPWAIQRIGGVVLEHAPSPELAPLPLRAGPLVQVRRALAAYAPAAELAPLLAIA